MAHQSPMISIPKKATEEVDWSTPIRNLIAQSYGENPENYATECASLQRCRQDAVRGAGSDLTARDLLYKYFGQLELLELRFSEIRVNFPWRDAFTNKLITQTSIAYEKASILFQIASTHSAIASSQSRSDPEGLKRAFHYFRTCAGMLTYINENFLHAPSTDLSREVIKFLVNIILAQATEVFFEKCTDEKKGNALVSKIGSQAASMYTSLTEEVKEFMGKGIFDRNWVTILQIKAKYFTSLSHYHRGLADYAASKYGESLVRFTIAENLAKEASRLASSFGSSFVSNVSPTLPPDAGTSIQERMKAHLALVSERKNEAQRENDLIYNAVLPNADALPAIDKTAVATPIPIQEVYSAPDVQKTIGQDFFVRLVPLSVHESASVYSEEKAKLVRGEVEKVEGAEGEAKSVLDGMGIKDGLIRFRAIAEGEVGAEDEIPIDVRRWKEDIALIEEREGVESVMAQLNRLKLGVQSDLDAISKELETESRDCEMMRVKYDHLWTQSPSASHSKNLRQDLKSHYGSLEAAATSDQQVTVLWDSAKGDIRVLLSPQLEEVFKASIGPGGQNLLDLDVEGNGDEQERAKIGQFVAEIEERIGKVNKISRERSEVLKDLKEKIQSDDVSHLLLINRRNTGVEPALFAAELEKFRPYQQRIDATIHLQEIALQEIAALWKGLKDLAGRGPGARRWEERERRKKDTTRRFSRARDGYMEVRDGLAKGLQFYGELTDLAKVLRQNIKEFVSARVSERESLVSKLELEKRLSVNVSSASAPPPKPPPPPQAGKDLDSMFSSMKLNTANSPPPPSASQWQPYSSQYDLPPPAPQAPQRQFSTSVSQQYGSQLPSAPSQYTPSSLPPLPPSQYGPGLAPPSQPARSSFFPPPPPPSQTSAYTPPPPPQNDPYANLGMFNPGASASPAPNPYASPPPARQPSLYSQSPHPPGEGQVSGFQPPPLSQPFQHQYGMPPPPAQQYSSSPPASGGYQYSALQGYNAYSSGYGH